MNPKSQPLPRSAFAAFCALALAASMALPFMGASKSYAEEVETPAATNEASQPETNAEGTSVVSDEAAPVSEEEAQQEEPAATREAATHVVTFGTDSPITVNAGESVVAPTRSDSIEYIANATVKTTAAFVGWYCVDPNSTSDMKGYSPLDKNGHYLGFTIKSSDPVAKNGVIAEFNLAEFKEQRVFFAGGDTVTVDKDMELYALYAYETVLSTGGSYFMGIDEAQSMGSVHEPKGWTLGKGGLGGGEINVYAHHLHPDFVLKGYYYGKDGKPTNVAVPLDTPINEDTEIWHVFVRNEPLSVSGAKGVAASGTLSGANVPVGAKVSVNVDATTSGEAYDALTGQLGSSMFGGVFEVTLLADGVEVHDGFGELTLSFPVGEENDGYNFTVYHRHQDGSIASETVMAENGVVTVTVTDLSSFALAKGEKASTGTGDEGEVKPLGGSSLAKTGDTTPVLAFGGFALAALGAVAFAGYRTRKSARK